MMVIASNEGCMDSNAVNYNHLATIDDSSCNYPLSFGAIQCGDPINVLHNISGYSSSIQKYTSFSFEVESDSTLIVTEIDIQLLTDNYYAPLRLVIFKDGNWFDSYTFGVWSGNSSWNNLPSSLILDSGEYTIIYSSDPDIYSTGSIIQDYISSLSFNRNYDDVQMDLSLTMYDGNCFKEGYRFKCI